MPEPYLPFTSRVIPLSAENVDTDQIVPARFLKVIDKAGLAEALFHDRRFDETGALHYAKHLPELRSWLGRATGRPGDEIPGPGPARP